MHLQSDCENCAGLCCSAFAFEPGPDFADDKPAGENCRHLTAGHRCAIHADRVEQGYSGCLGYECLGAGQAATALFPKEHAGEAPALRRARYESFRILRIIHALAAALQRPEVPRAVAEELMPLLEPADGWSYSALLDFDRSPQRTKILARVADELRRAA